MSERTLEQQLEKGEILKSVSWKMCKERAGKLSTPQGHDEIYSTPEDQGKVTFLQNLNKQMGSSRYCEDWHSHLGQGNGKLIKKLYITMEKEQIRILSSSVGLQEIDFNWDFFFFKLRAQISLIRVIMLVCCTWISAKQYDQILHTVLTQ